MQDTVIKLDKKHYHLDTYIDKKGQCIDFNIFFIEDREESHFNQLIVQASVNNEVAGYISLFYLSEENKNKYFNTPWDFYYNKKMSSYLKNLFHNDFSKFSHEVKNSFDIDVKNQEEFKIYAIQKVENDYKKFISFYLNKPYPEIVTVYSDSDKTSKNFSEFPFVNHPRKNTNFLGRGIANALYHCACKILKKDNMFLHASTNQTADGQRMWQQLTKNPKFFILSDNYWGSFTTDRQNIVELTRKKLTV